MLHFTCWMPTTEVGLLTLLLISHYWGIFPSKNLKAHKGHQYHLLKLVKHISLWKDASAEGSMQNHC